MAIKTTTICDACGKTINPAAGSVNLNPLRGGVTLEVATQFGSASQLINSTKNFCGPACLNIFVGQIAEKIVPAPAPAAASAAAPAKTA